MSMNAAELIQAAIAELPADALIDPDELAAQLAPALDDDERRRLAVAAFESEIQLAIVSDTDRQAL